MARNAFWNGIKSQPMKRFAFIIALTIFLKPVFPVVEYVVNYDYISTVLCVNKANIKMHCNGKCHLKAALAKNNESDKPTPSDKKHGSNDMEFSFCEPIANFEFPHAPGEYRKTTSAYPNFSIVAYHPVLLRPPIS